MTSSFWLKICLSFLVWIAIPILFESRRRNSGSIPTETAPVNNSIAKVIGLLMVSLAILISCLIFLIKFDGLTGQGIKNWAWLMVTLAGSLFVASQYFALQYAVQFVPRNVQQLNLPASSKDGNDSLENRASL